MNKKFLVKTLTIILAFSFVLSNSGMFSHVSSAVSGYSITGDYTISGLTVNLFGTASANPYTGQKENQHMGVDWTGACNASSATEFSFDSITFVGGTGSHQNNGTFTNATWSTSHSFPSAGTYSICVKVYHANFNGAEGSDAATFSASIVVPEPTMYSCNESTWQCDVSTEGTDLTTCEAACIEPTPTTTTTVPPTYYTCNENTWQCDVSTEGTDLTTCEAACVTPTGSLRICKYEDNEPLYQGGGNYTGSQEDVPLEAWKMRVYNNDDYNQYYYTEADGCVTVSGLDLGSYTVSEELPSNWAQMYPSNGTGNHDKPVLLTDNDPDQTVYFLNYYMTPHLPTMYACNSTTYQCTLSNGGQFGSLRDCQAACHSTTTTTSAGAAASFGGQYVSVVLGAATQQGGGGQVAGASTACNPYLLKYIKLGADNDPEEVKKLESFLNEYLGVDLPINGIFEEVDYNAVKEFQFRLKNEILAPWLEIGCLLSIDTPTGYVYRTTEWAINNMFCPISKPDVSDERCEGGIIIGLGEEGTVLGESTTTPTTTTETTPLETTETTGANVAPENGVNPSQNWIWYLIGIMIIGGAVYLVYSKKNK